MVDDQQLAHLVGAAVLAEDGDKIGKVGQVYFDDATGRAEWVTVETGLFGSSESFVPLRQATFDSGELRVPYSKSKVKDAPNIDDSRHLDVEEEEALYRYYGLDYSGTDLGGRATERVAPEGHDTSGPSTDSAMTRSEEELRVATQRQEAGRARLRKYVTTEQETVTVPVRREEVRVEREPITEANVDAAMSGPEISEEEHEVVLHEERPVVSTEAKPVERVRLDTDVVTENETVGGEVRKEHIEVEGDRPRPRG